MSEQITLELRATGGKTTGFRVPDDLVTSLGGGNRPKVSVTIGDFTFRGSIARMGGEFWLGVSAGRRTEGGLTAGETYDLTLELDTAPREVEVPDDLASALAAAPAAKTAWDALSYSNQRRHAEAVTAAKKPETRARRVAKTIADLTPKSG